VKVDYITVPRDSSAADFQPVEGQQGKMVAIQPIASGTYSEMDTEPSQVAFRERLVSGNFIVTLLRSNEAFGERLSNWTRLQLVTGNFTTDKRGKETIEATIRSAFEVNKAEFLRLRSTLAADPDYANRYIAVVAGGMVDSDTDRSALLTRVYGEYGYVPVYVGGLATQQNRYRRLPSPRRK
jgi:hypothetical protein